jgi:iron only hydrogenase large subunit-like protein
MNDESLHAISINEEKCVGCVHCMTACPTRAIRTKEGKARLIDDLCIDCGECIRFCPYDAVDSHTTSFSDLDSFKYKAILPATALYGQFDDAITPNDILASLRRIGFDQVFELSSFCELHTQAVEKLLNEQPAPRPRISSSCPVVVRLIQHRFPSLCDLIIPIEPPREIAAKVLRQTLPGVLGLKSEEIGLFHITPCPAKIVSINHPATMAKSFLDGAISIRDIYPKIIHDIRKHAGPAIMNQLFQGTFYSALGISWSMSGGEAGGLRNHRTVAVSGVRDTIRVLDQVEAGQLKDVDYLECMVCPDGCIGGPLNVANRFVAKSRINRLASSARKRTVGEAAEFRAAAQESYYAFQHPVKPAQVPLLDPEPAKAIEKAAKRDEILKTLSGRDCGACGAPDCRTLAEDVVRGLAAIDDCPFMRAKPKP